MVYKYRERGKNVRSACKNDKKIGKKNTNTDDKLGGDDKLILYNGYNCSLSAK